MHPLPTWKTCTLAIAACALAACTTTTTVRGPAAATSEVQAPLNTAHYDVSGRAPAEADGYQPPNHVGVLLPLTGALAKAAEPVRDGFLAAYYGEPRHRPDIRFYDTTDGVAGAYAKAAADGVDYIVGPLGREQVGALFGKGAALKVPVLALNHTSEPTPPGSVSFALTPEDEAMAVAKAMHATGMRHVLVVSGTDSSLRRAENAFAAAFTKIGGKAEPAIVVQGKATSFPTDLQAMLAKSSAIDGVFLATRGDDARAALPAIAASPIANLRRMATSQILFDNDGASDMATLDGVVFPTEAWNVRQAGKVPSAASMAGLSDSARGAAGRLFAFGYDAWLITAYLGHLASGERAIHGATGDLRLDLAGNIERTPGWSVFRNGAPVPLAAH